MYFSENPESESSVKTILKDAWNDYDFLDFTIILVPNTKRSSDYSNSRILNFTTTLCKHSLILQFTITCKHSF